MKLVGYKLYRMHDRLSGKPVDDEHQFADMLRYDRAFVHEQNWKTDPLVLIPRIRDPKEGTTRGEPTLGRWHSFAIKLEPILPPFTSPVPSLTAIERDAEHWYTYVLRNSTERIKLTLKDYVDARNFEAIRAKVRGLAP